MLPQGGVNLFQGIKEASIKAEAMGIELVRLSIGQPEGYPLQSAMDAASRAILSKEQSMHEYQDNGTPGVKRFSEGFVQAHVKTSLEGKNVAYLPTPGTKPMLTLFSLACGGADRRLNIAMMTDPGYPTPKDWAKGYLHHNVFDLPLNPENNFRFSVNDIPDGTDLVMINYPHNPSGQVATLKQLEELCGYCQEKGIRLVNDAAYLALSHTNKSSSLTDVAINYPGLSWIELFSSSKTLGNATGWRIGAAVGSPNFIKDLATIKGNTDSGFAAPLAAGVLYAVENDRAGIEANRKKYGERITMLSYLLKSNGMQLAVEPAAGFFTLWKAPRLAFGREMQDAADFNTQMINETGVVGVPFHPYVRYAVCVDVESAAEKIDSAFKKAGVQY
jgi:LL-diaminopimelate aminotransferase